MNWLTGLETAIEYIENNLFSRLDYEDIAAKAYCSSFHFQRMFSIFAGCTLGEYIRSRRMTLAGAELKHSDIKILDLAMKYGYENPESFTRAFTKFHGITPSDAKKDSAVLVAYTRFVNYESAIGGNFIRYSIVNRKDNDINITGEKLFDYDGCAFYSADKMPGGIYAVFCLSCEADSKKIFHQIIEEWLISTCLRMNGKSVYLSKDRIFVPVEV